MTPTDAPIQRASTPPPAIFSLHATEPRHIEALDALDFLTVAFRPIAGDPFHLAAAGVHGRVLTQWRTSAPFGFVSTPRQALDKMTIRFVSQGSMIRRNHRGHHVGVAGNAMLVAFEDMIDEEASAGFRAFTGTVDRSALIACHVALEGEDAPPFPHFLPTADIIGAPMRAFAQNFRLVFGRLQAGLEDGDLTSALLEEMLIYQFLAVWPKRGRQDDEAVAARPSWQVRRALDYIDANLQRRVSLADIASVSHVGVRSLQSRFRRELGKTPLQWILERRLAGVHGDLASSEDERMSVAAIARRWGFVHMGDFSRRYRQRYGATPLETRRSRLSPSEA